MRTLTEELVAALLTVMLIGFFVAVFVMEPATHKDLLITDVSVIQSVTILSTKTDGAYTVMTLSDGRKLAIRASEGHTILAWRTAVVEGE